MVSQLEFMMNEQSNGIKKTTISKQTNKRLNFNKYVLNCFFGSKMQ